MQMLAERPERLGYLLKDRVTDLEEFADALRRVADGRLGARPADRLAAARARARDAGPLADAHAARARGARAGRRGPLEPGRSPSGWASPSARVQKHVTAIFDKLGLPAGEDDNRRILAVLTFLRPRAHAALRRGARFRHPRDAGRPHRAAALAMGPSIWPPNQERHHAFTP